MVLESVLKDQPAEKLPLLFERLSNRLRAAGMHLPASVNTRYANTIPPENEQAYPGDREIERRIKSYIRWNAMAMVVNANRAHSGLGGHISTYASSATLYEVAFNHFFRGATADRPGDMIYFQGHASPGIYA
ncbi:MAG TPA: pyruvate dehydrogenase (acetyl-transferring), homodimeric type, partial [Bacteroidota bacterium]|nr:pyruvate dehydrogenase (acetyl-transferring), homodimeric type [Bacteroidota bacterium]